MKTRNKKQLITTLSNNTCNLPFYSASTCTLCVDALQAWPTKCCGWRSRYGKTCSFYMYSRTSRISWASTNTTAVRVYINSIYMTWCTEHFTCSIFGTATAAVTTAAVVVLKLTHRYHAVRGHRTGSNNCILPPLFSMHGIL